MEWTLSWYMRLAVDKVAHEEGMSVQEVTERFVRLVKLLGLDARELESVKMADVMRLAANAPVDIALRVMQLKAILPNTDLSALVPRCALAASGDRLGRGEGEARHGRHVHRGRAA